MVSEDEQFIFDNRLDVDVFRAEALPIVQVTVTKAMGPLGTWPYFSAKGEGDDYTSALSAAVREWKATFALETPAAEATANGGAG